MSKTYIPVALRELVRARAKSLCEYCLIREEDTYFGCQIDHILSEKHGGSTQESNLAYACSYCNRNKGSDIGSIVWEAQQFSRFFNPRVDQIWYVKIKDTSEIRPYKCKPHQIEQVHWAQTQTQLSATVIWATILKAFENWENPELDEIIAILNEDYPIHQITISMEQIKQMLNAAKNAADTRKKIWELMVIHEFDGNTDTATVFYKIANELDQDKRLIYKSIKNVQKIMKIEMTEYAS